MSLKNTERKTSRGGGVENMWINPMWIRVKGFQIKVSRNGSCKRAWERLYNFRKFLSQQELSVEATFTSILFVPPN